MNVTLTKVKMGEKHRLVDFKLGKLTVASVYYTLSYGVSYQPKFEQTKHESTWLTYSHYLPLMEFPSVDEAILKLKELCGEENFALLVQKEVSAKDDIEELDIIPPSL